MPTDKPYLIKGSSFSDDRGCLNFVNDFRFDGIKRFYTITHTDTSIIRAWQGHKIEQKHFFVSKGAFLINWIEIDNWDQPAKDLVPGTQILRDSESAVLVLPPGFANGFKALEPNSTMVIFSNLSLKESQNDIVRFPEDQWSFGF